MRPFATQVHGRARILATIGSSVGRGLGPALALGLVLCSSAIPTMGCGSSLRGPRLTEHATAALVPVPYPPPPARVEFIPASPSDRAVWIDGEWLWQGRRYAWKSGRWVEPPPGAAFAPWTFVRDEAGNAYVAEGRFRDAQGTMLPDPAPLAVGRATASAVVDPEGDVVTTGPTLRPSAGDPADAGPTDAGAPDAADEPQGY